MAERHPSEQLPWGTDDEFLVFMVRKLLWAQLIRGRAACYVRLTNQESSAEAVRLRCLIPHQDNFASWEVWVTPPFPEQSDEHHEWTGIFDEAGFTNRWRPDANVCPDWDEFAFGRVWATPMMTEEDYEFENVLEGDWDEHWPSLLMGSDYDHWAVLGMAAWGRIENRELVTFLDGQQHLDSIGVVEILALGEPPANGEAPFACTADSVISVLSRLRALEPSSSDSAEAALQSAARWLLEPLLVVTTGVQQEVISYVMSDPTCPAMHVLAINSDLPDTIRTLGALSPPPGPIPEPWMIKTGVVGDSQQYSVEEQYDDTADKGVLFEVSDDAAQHAKIEINALMDRIWKILPGLKSDSSESVRNHLQFLQGQFWLQGGIAVPGEMLGIWITNLTALLGKLESGDVDSEEVKDAARASWASWRR
jgi:hypothetical protein